MIGTSFSGTLFSQAIISRGSDQYVGYYDATQQLTIAHRTLPSGAWSTQTIAGSDATVGWDSHDSISLGIDSTGQLHVAANMHADPLRYWRTTQAGDISSLIRVPVMVDSAAESQVTYPQFIQLSDGTLTFNFRQGYSGEGSNYFYSYNVGTGAWTLLNGGPVFDGQSTRSTYDEVTPATDGWFNVTYLWRANGDASSDSRLSYVRTRDFTHWQTASGSALTLPLRYDTAGVVVDDIPVGGGLSDSHAGVDASGNLTVSYLKYDAEGTNQLYIARLNADSTWSSTQITSWTGRWTVSGINTQAVAVAFSATSPLPDGRDAVTFWCGSTHRTIVLDNTTLAPFAEVSYFTGLPDVIWTPTISYPGLSAQQAFSAPSADGTTYVLRWDSLGVNGDVARTTWPAAQPILVFTLAAAQVPSAPANVTGTRSGTTYTVTWTTPSQSGGSAITGYTVQLSSDNGATWTSAGTLAAWYTSMNINWLNGSLSYQFRVTATNAAGTSPASTVATVAAPATPTPVPLTLPTAPTSVTATKSGTIYTVSWTPPTVNAASAITGYTVQLSSDNGATWTSAGTLAAWYTSMNINWLNGSLSYQFRVTATNAAGTSPASTARSV